MIFVDRYFGDSEVWRISTAEPKLRGIMWEYVKDMSQYVLLTLLVVLLKD
jgi:hypothetical protein